MPYSKDYLQYVLEQLAGLRGAISRRMFGGAGLYYEELFFGLIAGDTLYFRVNDANRPHYEAQGMGRFRPYADKPHLSFNYYEVPAHVLEDPDELVVWARRSLEAAQAAAAAQAASEAAKRIRRTKAKRRSTAQRATKPTAQRALEAKRRPTNLTTQRATKQSPERALKAQRRPMPERERQPTAQRTQMEPAPNEARPLRRRKGSRPS